MFEGIDSLSQEIINVQVLDNYLKDGVIRFEKYFQREDYKQEIKSFENILEEYEEEESQEIFEDDGYIEEDYTLDDVLETLVADLDIYELIYKVPDISIENSEWEILFATIGEYYIEKELDGFFMNDMITLNRYAIARSMVYEEDSISLKTYISSLKYIESNILSIDNIVEIAERLGEKFKIDAVSLIANEDGSYGCVGRNLSVFLVDDEMQEKFDETVIKEHLEKNGYKVEELVDVIVEENNNNDNNSKIIDFNDFKAKRKIKN